MDIRLKAKYRQTGSAGSSPKSKPKFMPPGWHIEGKDARWGTKDCSKMISVYEQFKLER